MVDRNFQLELWILIHGEHYAWYSSTPTKYLLVNYFIIIFIEDVVSLIFIIKVKIKYKIFKQLFY